MENRGEAERLLLNDIAELRQRIAQLEASEVEQQQIMESLAEREHQLRLVTDALPTIISYVDSEQRYRFNNRAYETWFGISRTFLYGKHIKEVLGEEGYGEIKDYVELALSGTTVSHERAVFFGNDDKRVINAVYMPHFGPKGEVRGFFALGIDITELKLAEESLRNVCDELELRVEERTRDLRIANEKLKLEIEERKRTEERLRYISLRDTLTGLYNRAYFEEETRQLSLGSHNIVGIVICDVDGLKLINDSLGHETGDRLLLEISDILRKCSGPGDTIARIGGDEFGILLTNSNATATQKVSQSIKKAVAAYNAENPDLPLSISIGVAVHHKTTTSIVDALREADDNMYREKLLSSRSARNVILQTLMRALEARDFVTEGHVNRLQEMMTHLATLVGLNESRIADLRILAQFHDIGKVGVADRILFKPGPLSPEESEEMRRHCEIGHRIAMAAPDLTRIADLILKHHEWWNGHGYPLGLKMREIPLECRILAVADAYDAMTSERHYRKALKHEEAINELRSFAGIQFDPELVSKFTPELACFRA